MREFVQRQCEAREYGECLSRKVDASRASVKMSVGHPSDEVEAMFAARRAVVTG
jgi:hypothetical protein